MKNLMFCAAWMVLAMGSSVSFSAHHEESDPVVIGDVQMTEVVHSDGFNEIKKMVGKWEGKLTQYTGAVIDVSSEFNLVSGGNLITERLIEDGVEMLTTYSDDKDGNLVVKHYCALGTQPVFKVEKVKNDMVAVSLDASHGGYDPKHHSYVNSMTWTVNGEGGKSATVDSTLYIDGELVEQQSIISRIY